MCKYQLFFFFEQRKAYEIVTSLVDSEMCMSDRFDLAFTKAGGGGGGTNHVNGVSVASNSVESSDQTADAAFVETLDGKIKVLGFQQRVRIVFPKSQHCLPIQD